MIKRNFKEAAKGFLTDSLIKLLTLAGVSIPVGRYHITHLNSNRELVGEYKTRNIIVNVGLTYLAKILGKGTPQNFYIGLYSGAYTPQASDTMANFPSAANEFTGYSEANRVLWNTGANGSQTSPSCNNNAVGAEFNITTAISLTGAFLSSNPAKLSTTGDLFSGKGLGGAKPVSVGDILIVKYEVVFTNA